jgi:hypothetical protein
MRRTIVLTGEPGFSAMFLPHRFERKSFTARRKIGLPGYAAVREFAYKSTG